jgi:hypothetical protein
VDCGTNPKSPGANATVTGANYTENFIKFELLSSSGVNFGIEGSAEPFSKSGTGGGASRAIVPGVGDTIRATYIKGKFNDKTNSFKKIERDVVVIGAMPRHDYKFQSYSS